jgi:hypothetical protein
MVFLFSRDFPGDVHDGCRLAGGAVPIAPVPTQIPGYDKRATPAALERLLKLEIERWGRIIRDAGISPQ